jgi:multiple sugar transport system permease protein
MTTMSETRTAPKAPVAQNVEPPGHRADASHERRRVVLGAAALMAPTLLALLAVSLYPVLRSLWLSTRDTSLAQQTDKFVGLANYRNLWHDGQFWNAWTQTVGFTVASTLLETLIGLGVALVLSQRFRGRGFVRAAVLIPWAIPTVVTSRMFGWLLDGQNGVVNYVLVKLHLVDHNVNFLGSTTWAMPTIVLADAWKTAPFMALLILAGLQTIPASLTEAAHVDGASAWHAFWHIRLPLLMPSLLIAAMLRALDAFRVFDLPYTLTGGGPADSTETLSTLAYKRLFSGLQLGPGSSVTTAMFVTEGVIAVGFAYFIFRRMRASED